MKHILDNNNSDYFYTSSGIRIQYTTNFKLAEYDKSTPLIIFNYGLVCNPAHFSYQYPFFEERGFQILIHDYRCHYNSSGADCIDHCNFENMCLDQNELLNSFKAQNIHLIGHSMGVNLVLQYALTFPKGIKSISMISGTVLPPQEVMFDSNIMELVTPFVRTLSKNYHDISKKVWKTNYLNPISNKLLHEGGFNTDKVSIEFVQYYAKRISELPHELFLKLMEEMKKQTIINDLQKIEIPSLVIGGDADKVIPPHLQYILHEHLGNSKIYIIKDGSHVPQVDFPEIINERLLLHINNNG